MALVKCLECGKEISDKANVCPNCGYPLSEMMRGGTVRIKMPNNIIEGWIGLFSSRKALVKDINGTILWEGSHGENASFNIDKPTNILIELGGWANPVSGRVEPRKKYSLAQDMGVHLLATYRLTEVDLIDSD